MSLPAILLCTLGFLCVFSPLGEHKYIRRIMDVALPWSKYTDTLGMVRVPGFCLVSTHRAVSS